MIYLNVISFDILTIHTSFLTTGLKSHYKVCLEKKFIHICMYYANSGRASVKSLRSAKSRHPEDSKLVRQVLKFQKILPENMIEQNFFFVILHFV